MRYEGQWNYTELEADDSRIGGSWSTVFTEDTFIGAVGEAVASGAARIDNAAGSWDGTWLGYSDDTTHSYVLLDGSEAYEGLQAMLFLRDRWPTIVRGVVFPAPMPDLPEVATAVE